MITNIERAIAELKRGQAISIIDKNKKRILIRSAEYISAKNIPCKLILSANRAKKVFAKNFKDAVGIELNKQLFPYVESIIGLKGDLDKKIISKLKIKKSSTIDKAGLKLAKLAELIPAVAVISQGDATVSVSEEEINNYEEESARLLEAVCEAPLTLNEAQQAKIIVFRVNGGTKEHYAIIVGNPDKNNPPLVRVHSSCFTGDVLASLKCDCRDQLQESLHMMNENGAGILIYLMQEGRGIGLVNKLRAYSLQAQEMDTVAANEFLGFDDDERPFLPAAQMLKKLGFTRIRLLTNNPRKVKGLEQYGIKVSERVDLIIAPHEHNEAYLETKFSKLGHVKNGA